MLYRLQWFGLVKFFLTVSWALGFASLFLHFLTFYLGFSFTNVTFTNDQCPRLREWYQNYSVVSFSKEKNAKLGAGSVSLLFSRLTSPEQAGLKCSVWFEATAKIENLDFTSLIAHHRTALTWTNTCQGSACNSQPPLPKNMTSFVRFTAFLKYLLQAREYVVKRSTDIFLCKPYV